MSGNRWRNKTRGSLPVHPRFISGTRSVLSSWLLTSVSSPICLCKPFSCKACPGKYQVRRQPIVNRPLCSPIRPWDFVGRASGSGGMEGCLRRPGGKMDGCTLGAPNCHRPFPLLPAPPRSASPAPPQRAAPPRPARGISGFWGRQFVGFRSYKIQYNRAPEKTTTTKSGNRIVESKTWTIYCRVKAGRRTVGRRGRAGMGRTGRRRVGPLRIQPSRLPSRPSKKTLLDVSLGERTKEILCKPVEQQNVRLTSILSAGRRPVFVPGR